jgi:hypothetical protein
MSSQQRQNSTVPAEVMAFPFVFLILPLPPHSVINVECWLIELFIAAMFKS